jgi:Astacin (Peptidase family M12A)
MWHIGLLLCMILTNIPVCIWDGSSSAQYVFGVVKKSPSLDEVIMHVRGALKNSWEKYSSVRFIGFEYCNTLSTSELAKCIRLYIHPDAPNNSIIGKAALQYSGITTQFKPWGNDGQCIRYVFPIVQHIFDCVEQYAIHEFGHAIGFGHEWETSQTPDSCSNTKEEKPVPHSDTSTIYNPNRQNRYTIVDSNYDWDSIMTYDEQCAHVSGERIGSINLSPIDIKGVQAVYPTSQCSTPMAGTSGQNGFKRTDGSSGCITSDSISSIGLFIAGLLGYLPM